MLVKRLEKGTIEIALTQYDARALAVACEAAWDKLSADPESQGLLSLLEAMGAAFMASSVAAALQSYVTPDIWQAVESDLGDIMGRFAGRYAAMRDYQGLLAALDVANRAAGENDR
jgi:hypothetical protein